MREAILFLICVGVLFSGCVTQPEVDMKEQPSQETFLESTAPPQPINSTVINGVPVEYLRGVPLGFIPYKLPMFRGGWPRVVKFDGETFTDISVGLLTNSGWGVSAIGWNGEYWLMGVTEGGLIKYDGNKFEELSEPFELGRIIYAIDWNGDYWLIGSNTKLIKYDKEAFVDLSHNLEIYPEENIKQQPTITSIKWNGDHWLIGTYYGKLIKFDGVSFTELSNESETGRIQSNKGGGDYWVLSGDMGKLVEYGGINFTELTDKAEFSSVTLVGWNGEYWLIIGKTDKENYLPSEDEKSLAYNECNRFITSNSDGLAKSANEIIPVEYTYYDGTTVYVGNANFTGDAFKNISQKFGSPYARREEQNLDFNELRVYHSIGYSVLNALPINELAGYHDYEAFVPRTHFLHCIYDIRNKNVSRIQFSPVYFSFG